MAVVGLLCALSLIVRHPVTRLACLVREVANIPLSFGIYIGLGETQTSEEIRLLASGSAIASLIILALLLPESNHHWFSLDRRSMIPMPFATVVFFVLLNAQVLFWVQSPDDGFLFAVASLICGLLF